jgi:hypothetical protein
MFYLIYFSVPVFDYFQKIPGEARLFNATVPPETGGISLGIDQLFTDNQSIVEIQGWAFMTNRNINAINSKVFIILKSQNDTYIFETMSSIREDVANAYNNCTFNLEYCGFFIIIPIRKINNGDYDIGIFIKNGDLQNLQFTNKTIIKKGYFIETGS